MWDLAVREDDYAAVDTMLQRFSGAPLSFRIVPAYARHDSALMVRLHEEARVLDARQSQIAGRYVATYLEDFAAAEELARLDLAARRNAGIRLGAQTFLAWLEVARGRWSRAKVAFADAEAMEVPGRAGVRVERALAATLPFLEVPREELQQLRANIDEWNPASEPAASTPTLASALRPQLRLYVSGLLSSRLRDFDRATLRARELEQLPASAAARSVVTALVATVRADVALERGRPDEALQLLRAANGKVPLELVVVRPFVNVREFTQEHARYLRAEALLAIGRDEEARRWLETSFQGSPLEMVYLPPVHLRLAGIHQRRGDRTLASDHLRHFVAAWRECDPPLRRSVTDAEATLRRLGAQ
jgi:tetratricopeptide (TPR) repeat protein